MNPEEGYREAERRIEEFKRQPNASTLILYGLELESLPDSITELTSLQRLELEVNHLREVPPQIRALTHLHYLSLGLNRIAQIPEWFGELRMLECISFGVRPFSPFDNRYSRRPESIVAQHPFKHGEFDSNQLGKAPETLRYLPPVHHLDLSFNGLKKSDRRVVLPDSIRTLTLDGNLFTTVPNWVLSLPHLRTLHLNLVALRELPKELLKLKLRNLELYHNHGLKIPRSLLFEGHEEALAYYFNRRKSGQAALNESKILLLGRGEAGKSSIARALRELPFEKDLGETPGIDIHPWEVDHPNGELRVHLWDFAGQEITHETHRFFLTDQSLYVVVLDGRGGQQMEEAEYWLGHAQLYGTSHGTGPGGADEVSPVLVILNKWESPGGYELEKRRLKREFPNIRGFLEVDCKTGFGIEKLRQTVLDVLGQMEGVWQQWPLTYFNVRHRIDDLCTDDDPGKRCHFIGWDRFRTICTECGVSEPKDQQSLAANLHTLGAALYYGKPGTSRLRDTRVLNPNWAANGLYGIIRGVQKRPHKGKPGYLHRSELDEILKAGMEGMGSERGATADDYPELRDGLNIHEFLIELLIDRELGFPVDDQGLYLLPSLLSADEPRAEEFDVAAFIEAPSLRFRYTYEFLPAGIVSRFIVRTHGLSEKRPRWARGVVLEWNGAEALMLVEKRRSPRIDFFIRGSSARLCQELAGIIRVNMTSIHEGLPPRLKGEEELDLSLPGEQFRKVSELEALERAGKTVPIVDRGSVQTVEPKAELDRLQNAEGRTSKGESLKVFVSYSHENLKQMERFKPHLQILQNDGKIRWWYDGKIRGGADWDQEIQQELQEADIVIALISTPFLASGYVTRKELPFTFKQHKASRIEVLPVLLEPTPAFEDHEWLSKLQAAPFKEGRLRPMSSFKSVRDGWSIVDRQLRKIIQSPKKRPPAGERSRARKPAD